MKIQKEGRTEHTPALKKVKPLRIEVSVGVEFLFVGVPNRGTPSCGKTAGEGKALDLSHRYRIAEGYHISVFIKISSSFDARLKPTWSFPMWGLL